MRARLASPADDLPVVDALEVRGIVRVTAHVLGELRVPAEEQARQRDQKSSVRLATQKADSRAQRTSERNALSLVVVLILGSDERVGRVALLDPVDDREDHVVLLVENGRLRTAAENVLTLARSSEVERTRSATAVAHSRHCWWVGAFPRRQNEERQGENGEPLLAYR